MSRTEEVNKMTENVYKVRLCCQIVCLTRVSDRTATELLEMSCYYHLLLPTGDSGPVQPQSEELCDHGETLWESPDRLVINRPLIDDQQEILPLNVLPFFFRSNRGCERVLWCSGKAGRTGKRQSRLQRAGWVGGACEEGPGFRRKKKKIVAPHKV